MKCRNLKAVPGGLYHTGPTMAGPKVTRPVALLDTWPFVQPAETYQRKLQASLFLAQPRKPWLALNDLTPGLPQLPAQPPDEYRLSLGKITDTLRMDYQDFFQRPPDWSIYDQAVVLQLRKPWLEPKQMAGCKGTYVTMLKAIRKFCNSFIHDATVDCQVCDGRPYGCDLRVHWTCKGQLNYWIGEPSVMISAISLYTLKRCSDTEDKSLAWRVHTHIIDVTEIRPCSLRQRLMDSEALYSASC